MDLREEAGGPRVLSRQKDRAVVPRLDTPEHLRSSKIVALWQWVGGGQRGHRS